MKTSDVRRSTRVIMIIELIAGVALVAVGLWCCYLTAFRLSLWAVPVGGFATVAGFSLLDDFDRLMRYQAWRKRSR